MLQNKFYFAKAEIGSFSISTKVKRVKTKTVRPEEFYPLIGKITLIHAGIEQDIKGILIEDLGISEDKANGLYGFKLRSFFLANIKAHHILEKYYVSYSVLIDRFWKASDKRNELIKGTYSLVAQTREVYRHDLKERGKYDPEIGFDQWMSKGRKIITLEELESLTRELGQIRAGIFQLTRKVYMEGGFRDPK